MIAMIKYLVMSKNVIDFPLYKKCKLNNNYIIFSNGKIFSLYSNKFKNYSMSNGYYATSLALPNKIKKIYRVHRLIAYHFIKNNNNTQTLVNHIDGNKLNNNRINLEWITPSNNNYHAVKNKLIRNGMSYPVIAFMPDGTTQKYNSIADASKKIGVSKDMISHICRGECKTTKLNGKIYTFKFESERKKITKPTGGKKIKHFEMYYIYNDGRIFSKFIQNYMKQSSTNDGYSVISLKKQKTSKTYLVHRLVAEYFIGPPPTTKSQVNHIDNNRSNNHVSNLEYVTPSENAIHSYKYGKNKERIKKVQMIDINTLTVINTFVSISTAARETNIHPTIISNCIQGYLKQGKGYLWKYEEQNKIFDLNYKSKRKINMFNIDGILIKTFDSIINGAKHVNGSQKILARRCQSGDIYMNYRWCYSDTMLKPIPQKEYKKVYQYDIKTNELIQIFKHSKAASIHINGTNTSIRKHCTNNTIYKGFKWKWN